MNYFPSCTPTLSAFSIYKNEKNEQQDKERWAWWAQVKIQLHKNASNSKEARRLEKVIRMLRYVSIFSLYE